MKPVYLTTTLPYVNSDPHIGFALEIVHVDILARLYRLQGKDVFFNTGTDEHGLKIYQKAFDLGSETQKYVDEYAEKFRGLKQLLALSDDLHFIRTTDQKHVHATEVFWKRCAENGYIYKKKYKTKYCVGCELEKSDSEIENGRCFIHKNLELIIIEEDNYFFAFSKFQKKLLELYQKNPEFVVPDRRFNEIKAFVSRGLEDFSISRLKDKMPWGIAVPSDPDHVMYVWFDALVNYISTIGWPEDSEQFDKWWIQSGGITQFCGKDNLRQQAAMWQAMLMSVHLPPSKQIVIHGFITSGGQKMSKSLGNVISPYDLVTEYGTDAVRYFLSREVHPFEDSDVTMTRIKDSFNANLANGLGNLVSRIMKMVASYNVEYQLSSSRQKNAIIEAYQPLLESYQVSQAIDMVFAKVKELDLFIQKEAPFKKVKVDEAAAKKDVAWLAGELYAIGQALEPFMPATSATIIELVASKKSPEKPLFERKP